MSSGISFIKCTEVNQLKSMVQAIISEHEIVVLGRAKFSVFDQLEEKIDYCPSCNPTFEKINLTMGKLFGQVSSQLMGMGNFTISILDNFYSMSQAAQQSKDTIKSLETKSSEFQKYTSQLQTQNQNLRSRLHELQQMLVRTQKQLSTIQELNQLNQKLKNKNNFLENKLFVLENQLQIQKRQEVEILEKELEELRKKYLRAIAENQILEKQVMRVNQQLTVISTVLNKPSCIEAQCIYSPEIENKEEVWQKNSGELYRTIHQRYQGSPQNFQIASNSLFRDIGSEKVFKFNLFSPSVSNYDMNYGLELESHQKYSTFDKKNLSIKSKQDSNKENQNSNTNLKHKNISQKDQIKQGVISAFLTQKVDKGVQVNDFYRNQSPQQIESINSESTEAFIEIPVQLSPGNDKIYEDKTAENEVTSNQYSFQKIKLQQQRQEPLYLKWAKYLSDKCIKNRIKSKTKLILG